MENINTGIKSVNQMYNEEGMQMQIPPYQRPYRWGYKNVKQQLEDIATNKNAGKQKCRIGSVILYKIKMEHTKLLMDSSVLQHCCFWRKRAESRVNY